MLLLWFLPAMLWNNSPLGSGYRLSPSTGFWFIHLVLLFQGILNNSSKRNTIISWTILIVLAAALIPFQGSSPFSLFIEFRAQKNRLLLELLQHIKLAGLSLGLSLVISIPLGILSAKKAWAQWFYSLAGILQTIPSLALFGLLMVPYSLLSQRFPTLRTWGISGIGMAPAITALALYAMLPLMTGIREGLRSVPEETLQAGRGLGFSAWGLLWNVEFPLALPLIMAGFRTAVVQNLGNAALAPLIGAGGLGFFIFQGIGQTSIDMVLLGVFPLLILTLGTDALLGTLQTYVHGRQSNANPLV
jgi:osmoprotectant transport system permease protein